MSKQFGKRVRSARLRQGWSQQELADQIGVSQAAVSNWEKGNAEPQTRLLDRLKGVLGNFERSPRDSEVGDLGVGAFGAWLQKARTKAGMSVPELAQESGLSPVAIYNIEGGRSQNPQSSTRQKLEAALGAQIPIEVVQEAAESQEIEGLGSLTDFDPYNKSDWPDVPGVYVFYDAANRPLYVGKAQLIKRRIKDHEEKFWFKRPIVDKGSYVRIEDPDLRHQVEQILIRFLKTNAIINIQSVDNG